MRRTGAEVIKEFNRRGMSIAEWAKHHGFAPSSVYQVIRARNVPNRGKSHRIAILLGMKEGALDDDVNGNGADARRCETTGERQKMGPDDEREQAITALETLSAVAPLIAVLAAQRGRVAIIFDPAVGWCVSDDMDAPEPKMGPSAPEYRILAYKDWTKPTLEEAMLQMMEIQSRRR